MLSLSDKRKAKTRILVSERIRFSGLNPSRNMKIVIIAVFATLAVITISQGAILTAVKSEIEADVAEKPATHLRYHRVRRSEEGVDSSGIQERQLIVINGQAGNGGSTGGNNRGRRPGNGGFRGPGNGGFRGPGNGRGPGNRPFRGPPGRGRGWRNRGNQWRDDRDDFDDNNNNQGGGGGGGGGGGVGVCILCIGLRNNPQGTTAKP